MLKTQLRELIENHLFINSHKIETVSKCLSRFGLIAKSHYISHHDEINLLIFASLTSPPNYSYCLKYCEWIYSNKHFIFEALKPLNDLESLEAIRYITYSKNVSIYECGLNTQTIVNNSLDPNEIKSHTLEASKVLTILKQVEVWRQKV